MSPTPKRLEEARRRGEVAFSRDAHVGGGDDGGHRRAGAAGAGADGAAARLLPQGAFAAAPAGGQRDRRAGDGAWACWRASLAAPLLRGAGAGAGGGGAADARAARPRARCGAIWRGCRPPPGSGACSAGRRRWQVGKGLVKVAIVAALAWLTVRPVLGGVLALAGAPVAAAGGRARRAGRAARGAGRARGAGAGRGRLPAGRGAGTCSGCG